VEQDRIWHTLTIYVLCLGCIETDISIIIFVINIEYRHGTGFVFDTPSLLKRRRSLFLNNFVAAQPGNVHHYIHNSPPSAPILSQSTPPPSPYPNQPISWQPIRPSTPRFTEWPFTSGLPHQNLVHFSLLSCVCHMPTYI
jgi:hypothetical protein